MTGRWSATYGRKPPYARITGTSASTGNSRSAFAAIAHSTSGRRRSSKPTRRRDEPSSTVPPRVDSTTADVCSSAAPLPTAPT